jgi:hypothetical protein
MEGTKKLNSPARVQAQGRAGYVSQQVTFVLSPNEMAEVHF